MDMLNLLTKKRYSEALTEEEIFFFVDGVTAGTIPDYQITAFLMAVALNGMDEFEMTALTLAMSQSGEVCDLSAIETTIVDKHSTGGVGDKCTPILLSIVAACGVPVVKLSGRGLGFTGGTIDKLESIRGFRTEIAVADFVRQVELAGVVLSGQTPKLAPADKVLYALRDVTATVESVPLIASSVMSKKIAGGADAIVLDVTYGSGAFMKTKDAARELSAAMIRIGHVAKRPVICVLTPMEQPLGWAVGNALEIDEIWQTLSGNGAADLLDVCLALAACMLQLSDVGKRLSESMTSNQSLEACRKMAREVLENGRARETFSRFLRAQGGETDSDERPILVDVPVVLEEVESSVSGYLSRLDALCVGEASMLLGAGRRAKSDVIDPGAGIRLSKKIGDRVEKGEVLATFFKGACAVLSDSRISEARAKFVEGIVISEIPGAVNFSEEPEIIR